MDTEKSKLYTKGGDKGRTSLVGGQRVPKYDLRLECYGTVDELNAFVGVLLSHDLEVPDQQFLLWLQHKLFSVGGYLATAVTERAVAKIEREIDRLDGMVPPLKAFILPSGGAITAAAHVCRTVCRRAERIIYRLNSEVALEPNVLRFMNRLSDYFFALARKEVLRIHGQEIVWTYDHNDD